MFATKSKIAIASNRELDNVTNFRRSFKCHTLKCSFSHVSEWQWAYLNVACHNWRRFRCLVRALLITRYYRRWRSITCVRPGNEMGFTMRITLTLPKQNVWKRKLNKAQMWHWIGVSEIKDSRALLASNRIIIVACRNLEFLSRDIIFLESIRVRIRHQKDNPGWWAAKW